MNFKRVGILFVIILVLSSVVVVFPTLKSFLQPKKIAEKPKGIYTLTEWNQDPDQRIWNLSYIDGVVIRSYWNDLNPQAGSYNWDYLDRQFTNAREHHKKVRLAVAPGFYAPDFVLHDPSVTTALFTVPQGPYKDSVRPLPLPWDNRYLSYWFDFLDILAQRYRDNPAFTYISITGPNSHNGEISLPRTPEDEATWKNLTGETKTLDLKLTEAWQKTFSAYCKSFPGKYVTLALISKSLPLSEDQFLENAYMEKLASLGLKSCPQGFGLQTNGLDGRPMIPNDKAPLPQWDLVTKYSHQALTIFQTRTPHNIYKCRKRDPSCRDNKEEIFRQTIIGNGLSRNPDILELYESDVLDPLLTPIILEAHQALTH